jgi:hypothetical protein
LFLYHIINEEDVIMIVPQSQCSLFWPWDKGGRLINVGILGETALFKLFPNSHPQSHKERLKTKKMRVSAYLLDQRIKTR